MTAASWRFWTVYVEDVDKLLIVLKQLDYSISISTRDSWLGLHPRQIRQLFRDKNLEFII